MNRRIIIWIIIGVIAVFASYRIYNLWSYSSESSFFGATHKENNINSLADLNIVDSPDYVSYTSCPSAARKIISKYNIDKNKIENCQEKIFRKENSIIPFIKKNTSLVHIEYGGANDCEAGCFFSHYCAIIENGNEYPYAFYFTSKDENIFNLPTEIGSGADSRYYDNSIVTGRDTGLAKSDEFNNFLQHERTTGGDFRWCYNKY